MPAALTVSGEAADLAGPDAELDRRDLVGLEVERAGQALAVEQLEPGFLLQVERHGLRDS